MFRKRWRKLLAASLVVGTLTFAPEIYDVKNFSGVHAEVKLYTAMGVDYGNELESQDIVKLRARDKAIKNAVKQAGVYLKTYSRSVNSELTDDEITAITSNAYELVGEPKYNRVIKQVSDQITLIVWEVTVNVNVDDVEVRNWIKRDYQERSNLISQTRELNEAAAENDRKVEDLRKRANNVTDEAGRAQLKTEFEQVDKEFLYNQKIEEGERAAYKGDFEESAKLLSEAIEINPDNPKAYVSRGGLYGTNIGVMKSKLEDSPRAHWIRSHGNNAETYYKLALADLNKAIELNPNDPNSYTTRGRAHYNFEKYPQALKDWDKALQIDPAYLQAYIFRYLYHSHILKDKKLALADLNKAIELNPDNPLGYSMRSLNYLFEERYDLALSDINKAIELNPNEGHPYSTRGDIYLKLKDYNRAVEDFNRCFELDPKLYTVYYGLAEAHEKLGQYDLAAEDYTQVIKNLSDKMAATWYYKRGVCYQKLKLYDKAIEDFTQTISIMGCEDKLSIFFELSYKNRGECYEAMGETSKAQADFAKAKQLENERRASYG